MRRILTLAVAILGTALPGAPPAALAAGPNTMRFVALAPVRLADTRDGPCACTRVDASTIRVSVAGSVAVGDVAAAAVTVTAVHSVANGFVTAYPAGAHRPDTSTLNARYGAIVSNSTIVPLGVDGSIDIFSQVPAALVVDLTGVFTVAASSAAGRFIPLQPARLIDTRDGRGALAAGETVTVPLPAVASTAIAVAVNVTSVDAPAAGYLSGFAAGGVAPFTSFLNPDGSGAALAASVLLPVSPSGLAVLASTGGHVIVDVVGWFTGPTAAEDTAGLFVTTDPTRLLDTRSSRPRLWPAGTRETQAPAGAAALVTNITMALPDAPGFVTAYPAGTERPSTSSVNAAARDVVVANLGITATSSRGVAYFANAGTDLAVDMFGYFTGAPAPATLPPPPNETPPLRVLLIGDSTLGALNVVPRSQSALRGFEPIVDAEPCRRLVRASCTSAYTLRTPNTAVQAIATAPGPIDIVVIRAGYNDGSSGFPEAVDAVVRAARDRGIRFVLWLTYSSGTGNQLNTYNRHNDTLRQFAVSGRYPELVVAPWREYAASSPQWYAADQVHLGRDGAWATTDYIARWVAAIGRRPCPAPWTLGGPIADPCPTPEESAAAQGPPDLYGLYGL